MEREGRPTAPGLTNGRPTAPGLKWRTRKHAPDVPLWVARPDAIAKGYPVKTVRLDRSAGDAALVSRCHRLQSEMLAWLGPAPAGAFDGSWKALFDLYERETDSPFHKIKPGSVEPYTIYLGKLRLHLGARRISECDGRDAIRWFGVWSGGSTVGEKTTYGPKLAAARTCLAIIKAALGWGIARRKPGCAEFKAILAEIEFPRPKQRNAAPTAADVERARAAAHAAGAPSRAMAYALQFETTLRQWDVIGQWFPLAEPRASAVLCPEGKWFGLQWSHVNADWVVRYRPTKTEETSEAEIAVDLAACPMVLAELERVPPEARTGPIIADERTGLPYLYKAFRRGWRADFKAAGIDAKVWNRDFRAGGQTEGRKAAASKDDLKKLGGHTERSRSAEIYDRAALEAHRRVAAARKVYRDGGGSV